MTEDEKIQQLMWQGGAPDEETARRFLQMFESMREIEREEAEETRVAHARAMSQRKR